jgi:hypothetical protein
VEYKYTNDVYFAEARLAEIHAQRAALVEKRILLRQEQAEQKKLLMDAVETMKKTKKWEAPPGISMDIDMEGLVSKVQNERSAGTLPAIRPSESTTDVAATSSTEKRPKSRSKEPSNVSHAENSLPVPHPPVAEKPIEKSQQVKIHSAKCENPHLLTSQHDSRPCFSLLVWCSLPRNKKRSPSQSVN